MSRYMIPMVALVLAGCVGERTNSTSYGSYLSAPSYASLSKAYGDPSRSSGPEFKWSPRGGLVMFLGTSEDVDPRLTVGGYTRMMESDTQRLEIGVDLTPEIGGDEENMYATFMGDYVFFLGEGTLSLKAGAGAALEFRAGETYSILLAEAGVGLWLPVGKENAFIANMMLQIPLGDSNPSSMLAVTAGYEF